MVTRRLRPLRVDGQVVHQIGLPFHWGFQGRSKGGIANDLTHMVLEPNVGIEEAKAFTCNVRAGRLHERDLTTMVVESKSMGQLQRLPLNVLNTVFSPFKKEPPPPPQSAMGFFTDTSICIGCKACEIACKQWNQLPAIDPKWTGTSYDNTQQLSARTWRHVQFIEQIQRDITLPPAPFTLDLPLLADALTEAKNNGIIPETPPGNCTPIFYD